MNSREPDYRPNPDELLAAIQQEERRRVQGKLKIFLGMCAGVGKTYAMLQDARQRRQEGVDVVAGVVVTHGRIETETLLHDFPVIPLREISYRSVVLREMDLDAILSRRPGLALVDELAHTNAPGSRHPKRYQDALELLEAGIDVYTTMNIQHLESRVDAVAQITGVKVQETVPDSIIDRADEIQLMDLTPELLRERLAEGKVYMGDKVATAASHFFREENLVALREMALRLTAEHVGQSLRGWIRPEGAAWKPMVAVGHSTFSESLIRTTRRMAAALDAPWIAAYVECAAPLEEEEKRLLEKNLTLARQLGARVIVAAGEDLAASLLEVAREHNVTQMIVGRPRRPLWRRWFKSSLAAELVRRSAGIDIMVARSEPRPEERRHPRLGSETLRTGLQEFTLSTAAVGAVTLGCWVLQPLLPYVANHLVYLGLVIFTALRFSRQAVFWVATLSLLAWNFYFVPPRYAWAIYQPSDLLLAVLFYAVALVTGLLLARVRLQAQAERRRDKRTTALYHLAQSVVASTGLEEGLARVRGEIDGLFTARSAILLLQENGRLAPHPPSDWLDAKEISVASWSLLNNRQAGRFTDTLPESKAIYLPLATGKSKTGVLAVQIPARRSLGLDELELLEAFADQVAVMVERYHLIQENSRAQVMREAEQLYKAIFDSVSHELKTPLDFIADSAARLERAECELPEERAALGSGIHDALSRLRRTVDNLVGMSRVESGTLKLEENWVEVAELVHAARQQAADMLADHRVRGNLGPELPLVRLDFGLMVHALANLLMNAGQYSPPGTEVRINAHLDEGHLVIQTSDEGPGLPPGSEGRIFEKFYRGPNAAPGGSGLGLSIAKALVEAHRGRIAAENNPEKGAAFTVRIPVEAKPLELG